MPRRAFNLQLFFFCMMGCLLWGATAVADDPPNPSTDALQTDIDTPLTFALDDDAQLVGTPEADGVPTAEDGRILEDVDTYIYTPADGFEGTDQFSYEICGVDDDNNPVCDTPITVEIHVGDAADLQLVLNGPQEGSTHNLSPSEDSIAVHGKTAPFKSVHIYLDDEEIGTSNADGKGAWTFNLPFSQDTHEAGDYVVEVEDEDGNRIQVTIEITWDEQNDDNDTGGGLPGQDPDIAQTGGRVGSCTTTTPLHGGLWLIATFALLLWMRRKHATA